ncbi:unnamed protein product [Diabrotica balteata]|uniref:MADF domain-containing protein n=1 Tax=Diabrotica balteata TaxID=107213 RepID=A0A9N9SRH4_DIABA|nr:unnamed protein product [Diabrotica balteata]
MEVKQEVDENIICKTEIHNNDVENSQLDIYKIEIKEEPKIENAGDIFDHLDLKEYPAKTEIDEDKFVPVEEKQTNETEEEYRKRWRNLRECYRRALKARKSKSGQADIKIKTRLRRLEKQMSFMQPFLADQE